MATKIINKSDAAHQAERWAKHIRDIARLEDARDADKKIAALVERHAAEMEKALEPYQPEIEKLEAKASPIYDEIIDWLGKQKKSVTIETTHAIAQLLTGTRPGNRVPDVQKFIALCKKKEVEPWAAINVIIKLAEPIVGRHAFDEICTSEQRTYSEATLKLK